LATIDPNEVRFSQASISYTFADGTSIDDLAERLRTGAVSGDEVLPIRLCERNGVFFTLDNRRLEAFRRAHIAVPYRMATVDEIETEAWKFTTRDGGIAVRVRRER